MAGNKNAGEAGERRALGLFVRRTCWTLSWRAKFLVLVLAVGAVAGLKDWIFPFLSVSAPERGGFLVVEGWMPPAALDDATNYFARGNYQAILTSGGQAKGQWSIKHGVTYAALAEEEIRRAGFPSNLVAAVPAPLTVRDRTYHSALAVKKWLEAKGETPARIDVLTMGPHARRSRLLFQEAMGPGTKVGVIALRDDEYDGVHWWRSSEGVREVISESIAYVYARVIFRPSKGEDAADLR